MRAGQRKPCGAVIECRGREAHRSVACGAVGHSKSWSRSSVRRCVGSLPAAAIIRIQVAAGISAIGGLNV